MKKMKIIMIWAVAVMQSILVTSCGGNNQSARESMEYRYSEGAVWSTTYHITYEATSDLSDSITAVMRQVELSLSPFDESSIISRVNRNENPVVDARVEKIFAESQRVNKLSDGMFDPTVAPLVNKWGFGYKNGTGDLTQAEIDTALMSVGIADCQLVDHHIVKKHADTEFNFSAITKGFGCDEVARMLERNGSKNYMVEIGGEITLAGKNRKGDDWHIQVDAPIDGDFGHNRMAIIVLSDCGIATSGNYRNFRDTKQGRVGHTISPKTGYPVKTDMLSVTVIAPSTMLADALATASMAMPVNQALEMIEGIENTEALMVTSDGKDGWTLHKTKKFPELKK
jgi:thiamine biosynthesis lipoprotein